MAFNEDGYIPVCSYLEKKLFSKYEWIPLHKGENGCWVFKLDLGVNLIVKFKRRSEYFKYELEKNRIENGLVVGTPTQLISGFFKYDSIFGVKEFYKTIKRYNEANK